MRKRKKRLDYLNTLKSTFSLTNIIICFCYGLSREMYRVVHVHGSKANALNNPTKCHSQSVYEHSNNFFWPRSVFFILEFFCILILIRQKTQWNEGRVFMTSWSTIQLLTFDKFDIMVYQPWRFYIHRGQRHDVNRYQKSLNVF